MNDNQLIELDEVSLDEVAGGNGGGEDVKANAGAGLNLGLGLCLVDYLLVLLYLLLKLVVLSLQPSPLLGTKLLGMHRLEAICRNCEARTAIRDK